MSQIKNNEITHTGNSGTSNIVLGASGEVTPSKLKLGSDAAGDTMYSNGTQYVRLAKGTAGQALKMNAGATAPEWGSVATTGTTGATDFTIADGNLVVAAGHGIDFSANTSTSTTDAAMTSELLDWYEEGTFTPKITFGGTSGFTGGSYGTCTGTYTRVGRMVTISFTTIVSAKGSSSGLVHINGLPFNSGGSTFRGGGRTSYATLFSTETDNVDCQLYLGDNRTYLQCVHDSLDNLNASDCNSSGEINTTMQYQAG